MVLVGEFVERGGVGMRERSGHTYGLDGFVWTTCEHVARGGDVGVRGEEAVETLRYI